MDKDFKAAEKEEWMEFMIGLKRWSKCGQSNVQEYQDRISITIFQDLHINLTNHDMTIECPHCNPHCSMEFECNNYHI